jgi:hypothetical protein
MFYRTAVHSLVPLLWLSSLLAGQQSPPAAAASATDFPVLLQQAVTAGKTPVGTKIEARLQMATLYNGTVIPRNAVFSGQVVDSSAKTGSDPSRLSIVMDAARWKNGTLAVRLSFNGWYYPTAADRNAQDLQYGPPQPANRTWNGQGQYPDPNSRVYRPFPSDDDAKDKDSPVPNPPTSAPAKNRALIKDVEVERTGEGTLRLVSKRANIKLEKYTAYVLAAADSQPPAQK